LTGSSDSLWASGPPGAPMQTTYAVGHSPLEAALVLERGAAFLAAAVCLALQLALVGLAFTASHTHPRANTTWQLSFVFQSLLLTGVTMVALLLAIEPVASRLIDLGYTSTARVLVWSFRGVTVAPVFIAIALACRVFWCGGDPYFSWGDCAFLATDLLLVSAAIAACTYASYRPDRGPTASERDEHLRLSHEEVTWAHPVGEPKIVAVGASGGGIRAASFVLGGHQALQLAAPALGMAEPEHEPDVFAVSGGSYVAAALAMRRSFDPESGAPIPLQDQQSWTKAYELDSVELERLRRHTRYLFEPRSRTLDGAFTLLTGAMINLFVAGAALLAFTWVSVQIVVTLDLLDRRDEDSVLVDFWVTAQDQWLAALLVPAVLMSGVVALTVSGWVGEAKFDREAGRTVRGSKKSSPMRGRRRRAERLVRWSGRGRAPLTAIALGWLLLSVGLPAATTGVAEMATRNEPTATIARGLAAVGLATRGMCSHAFEQSLHKTFAEVVAGAKANPGAERSATAGACGAEYEVIWTAGGDVAQPTISAGDVHGVEEFANLDNGKPVGRIGAVAGLLLSVLALLRRGPPAGEAGSNVTRFAALRRRLLTVLPLGVMAILGVYLMLLSFRWLVAGDTDDIAVAAILAVIACAIAFLLDANGTSMHSFYRSCIADAFAVGVRRSDPAGVAEPLPRDAVYRFSDLRGPDISKAEEAVSPMIESAREDADTLLVAKDLALAERSNEVRLGDGGTMPVKAAIEELADFEQSVEDVRQSLLGPSRPVGGRLHIVATLNSRQANESPTMRGGFPVVLGAREVRVFREGGLEVLEPMRSYENFAGPGRVSILSSVAISGAAISPLMGRYAEQMAPYRFLLALFNVRLGTWVLNPALTPPVAELGAGRRNGLWMSSRPGLINMLAESLGSVGASERWVYLSDGGHLDNTGMVEAVRHCVRLGTRSRVLILDASNDTDGTWQAVGDAVAVIRADLCLDLQRHGDDGHPPWMRLYAAHDEAGESLVEVLVVKAVRVEKPVAGEVDRETRLAVKIREHDVDVERVDVESGSTTDWWAKLPPDVQSFQARHADFPRAPTGRQRFGDLEFEAYRAFGFAAVTEAFRILNWV
jgi:hypothetical protein